MGCPNITFIIREENLEDILQPEHRFHAFKGAVPSRLARVFELGKGNLHQLALFQGCYSEFGSNKVRKKVRQGKEKRLLARIFKILGKAR